MAGLEHIHNAIRGWVKDTYNAVPYDASTLLISADNTEGWAAEGAAVRSLTVRILDAPGSQGDIGAAQRRFRREGLLQLEIRGPAGQGDSSLWEIADNFIDAIEGGTKLGTIVEHGAEVTVRAKAAQPFALGREESEWRIDVRIPWFADVFHA